MTKLYIGNLPFSVDREELSALVSQFGTVRSARVIIDRFSGRSQGYGFVEMKNAADTERVICELSGFPFKGRALSVSYARASSSEQNTSLPGRSIDDQIDRFATLLVGD
jgi:RNA recognition motif-containing protein